MALVIGIGNRHFVFFNLDGMLEGKHIPPAPKSDAPFGELVSLAVQNV